MKYRIFVIVSVLSGVIFFTESLQAHSQAKPARQATQQNGALKVYNPLNLFCQKEDGIFRIRYKYAAWTGNWQLKFYPNDIDGRTIDLALTQEDCSRAIRLHYNDGMVWKVCIPQPKGWQIFAVKAYANNFHAVASQNNFFESHSTCFDSLEDDIDLEKIGADLQKTESLPLNARHSARYTSLMLLERWLAQSSEKQGERRVILNMMRELLKDADLHKQYQSRDPLSAKDVEKYVQTNDISSLLKTAEANSLFQSGHNALKGLAHYYSEKNNPTLAATYWNILESLGGNVSEKDHWSRIHALSAIASPELPRLWTEIETRFPNVIIIEGPLRTFDELKKKAPTADGVSQKQMYDQIFDHQWLSHYRTANRLSPHLKNIVSSQRPHIEAYARRNSSLNSLSLGKHLIGIDDEGPIIFEAKKNGFGRPLRFQVEEVKKVVSGFDTCALTRSGKIECLDSAFTALLKEERATDICASSPSLFCTINQDTTARCWDKEEPNLERHRVSGATQLVCGAQGVCAVSGKKMLTCWGSWVYPMDETTTRIVEKEGLKQLAVGQNSCALTEKGRVRCWGSKMYLTPVDLERTLKNEGGASRIGVFAGFACVTTQKKNLHCWNPQFPDRVGPSIPQRVSERVRELGGAVDILASNFEREDQPCVVTQTSGVLVCWSGDSVFELDFDRGEGTQRVSEWLRRWETLGVSFN